MPSARLSRRSASSLATDALGWEFPSEVSAPSRQAVAALGGLHRALRLCGLSGQGLEQALLAWATFFLERQGGAGGCAPPEDPVLRKSLAVEEAIAVLEQVDWPGVSPAVLGTLFQGLLDSEGKEPTAREASRRELGAHYTEEALILRVLKPLFLDALEAECALAASPGKGQRLLRHLGRLTFLDPACGAGNFLLTTYVQLRRLEWRVWQRFEKDLTDVPRVRAAQMHGIELDPVAGRLAQTMLRLAEAWCDRAFEKRFGQPPAESPRARITTGNALQLPWEDVLPAERCDYIIGNPPFVGAKQMTPTQRSDAARVFQGIAGAGVLDYVAAWHVKAARYIQANPRAEVGLVSTNSLAQGEQPGVLWPWLWEQGVGLNFACPSFPWTSSSAGAAAVHCIVLGFGLTPRPTRALYAFAPGQRAEPVLGSVSNISPYLVEGPNVALPRRSRPWAGAPVMATGNKPIDGGHYLFTPAEKEAFVLAEPAAAPLFQRWVGSEEFLKGVERWVLWLGGLDEEALASLPLCRQRVEAVRQVRLSSGSPPTQRLAARPRRFHVECFPPGDYLVVPETSSERRARIPLGYFGPGWLPSSLVRVIPNASLYVFGVLSSAMHQAWVDGVSGRMKNDYRYSINIVYNNFPWPEACSPAGVAAIERAADEVLQARRLFPGMPLGEVYGPALPAPLEHAHALLDAAVDKAYGYAGSDQGRLAFLLNF